MSILDLVEGKRILELWAFDAAGVAGELDPVLDGLWAELEGDFKAKVDSYCHLIREFELLSMSRSAEAARIQALADSDQQKARNLKARLLYFFGLEGIEKLETKNFRLSVCQNGGHQPFEITVPAEMLPDQCKKVEVKPDMDFIRQALKGGALIHGVNVLPRGQHLRIK
jgi:hypothetical protein